MKKTYDRAYFDRWYRSPRRVVTPASLERQARLALAASEFALGREARNALDIGCGEALWRGILRKVRPSLDYVGVDPSAYVVRRYGRRRNIAQGDFAAVGRLGIRGRFDLIVCSDVLQYLPSAEIRDGLPAVARMLRGVLWLRVCAREDEDDVVGDREGWYLRSARWYRRALMDAGLAEVGLGAWMNVTTAATTLGSLERPR